MSESARITSIDALRELKAAIAEFCDRVNAAFAAVDADLARTTLWLNQELPAYYKQTLRRTEDQVAAARGDIRRKQITRDPDPVSIVEEKQALDRLKRRIDEIRTRQDNVRRWAPQWEHKAISFMSARRRLGDAVQFDLPRAMERLERASLALEEYVRLQPPDSDPLTSPGAAALLELIAPPGSARPPVSTIDTYAPLRSCALPVGESDQHQPAPLPASWEAGALSGADSAALAGLASATAPPAPADLVTLSWRALQSSAVFMVRHEPRMRPDGLRDSGWFVGPLDRPESPGSCGCLSVERFLTLAPSFASLLALAPGALAVIARGEIKSLLDHEDHELWSAHPRDGVTLPPRSPS